MSANNQVLVKEYKGKWYVFNSIMAESWSDKNELDITEADFVFDNLRDAMAKAYEIDATDDPDFGFPNSEYGVGEILLKDGADVELYDSGNSNK